MADVAIEEFRNLSSDIGTHVPLGALGVRREDFDLIAQKALADMSLLNNPVQPTADEIVGVLQSVY